MKFRSRKVYIALFLALVLSTAALPSCAGNNKPETVVAVYGTNVLGAATELQKGVTAATDAGVIPVPKAQEITKHVKIVYDKAGPLGEALRTYNAATSVSLRNVKASEIQGWIADINGAIANILNVSLPDGAVAEISKLVGKVLAAISAVQAEVAKGLGGS